MKVTKSMANIITWIRLANDAKDIDVIHNYMYSTSFYVNIDLLEKCYNRILHLFFPYFHQKLLSSKLDEQTTALEFQSIFYICHFFPNI